MRSDVSNGEPADPPLSRSLTRTIPCLKVAHESSFLRQTRSVCGPRRICLDRSRGHDDEGDDRFKEEPRCERLLQRTDVERAWIYDRHRT